MNTLLLQYFLRFDLIFLMLDPQDEAYDRRLAHHLVALYYQSEEQMEEEFMDMAVLKDYIAYAHSMVMPRLSQEASQTLIEVTQVHVYSLKKCLSTTIFFSFVAKWFFQMCKGRKG